MSETPEHEVHDGIGEMIRRVLKLAGVATARKTADVMDPEADNPCERKNDRVHVFYGYESPFSNFYACNFTVDGTRYNCVEQYFQSYKAGHFKDETARKKIMSLSKPSSMKAAGRRAKNFDIQEWKSISRKVLKEGVYAKFSQNPNLRDRLVATGDKRLGEACGDKNWGTGIRLKDKRALDVKQWVGENNMGDIITEVREALK